MSKLKLPENIDQKLEFSLYESIVHGDLRPYLEIYSSKNHIQNLMKKLWSVYFTEDKEGLIHTSDSDLIDIYIKGGDTVSIKIEEIDGELKGTITPKHQLEKLIDIDIPPPPDLKATYFLDLIKIEYEKIKLRAKRLLKTSLEENQISLFANNNIQIAKRIAVEAHKLSKQLKPHGIDELGNPDYYIIDILKTYMIRSILFYQELFQPYIKAPIQDEFQLKMTLYEARSVQDLKKDLDQKVKNKFYERLNNEIQTLRKKPNNNGLDQQISKLKILTLKKGCGTFLHMLTRAWGHKFIS